jgi:hypothetical protein
MDKAKSKFVIMKKSNLLCCEEYVIDADTLAYRAVWNCQVEWTAECIFYDAETGVVAIINDEFEFIRDHHHKVTKAEYLEHVEESKTLKRISLEELKDMLLTSSDK